MRDRGLVDFCHIWFGPGWSVVPKGTGFGNTSVHTNGVLRRILVRASAVTAHQARESCDHENDLRRGSNENGKQVASVRGNPEIGPFYIEGAEPGDVLIVTFDKIETNRKTSFSGSALSPYTADPLPTSARTGSTATQGVPGPARQKVRTFRDKSNRLFRACGRLPGKFRVRLQAK